MNDKSKVTDRELERLRLGELSDEDSKRLLARLEADGELERFEQLVAADEEFLERFPAEVAAANIREELRRADRAGGSQGLDRRARGRGLVVLFGSLLLGLVVAALLWVGGDNEPDGMVEARGETTKTETETTETMPSGPAPPSPAVQREEWGGLLDWVLRQPGDDLRAMACVPGEELAFDATGVTRIRVDETNLIQVRASEDGSVLTATCEREGLGSLHISREGAPATNLIVRIAPPYEVDATEPASVKQVVDDRCPSLEDMELRIVVENGVHASMVLVGGGTEEQRGCVREAANDFEGSSSDVDFQVFRASW